VSEYVQSLYKHTYYYAVRSTVRTEEEELFRDAFLREELEDHIFFSCGVEDVALRLRLPRGIHLNE
jgi:hypothetical protein